MTKHEKIENIIAFLSILFGEEEEINTIMKFSPDYIIEKFERYIESTRVEYPWGMHPILRLNIFQRYVDEWELELKNECQHESDGQEYTVSKISSLLSSDKLCKKCGEFYR